MNRHLLALLPLALPFAAAAQTTPAPAPAEAPVQASLVAPGLRVSDMERSLKFYATALNLVPAIILHHGTLSEAILSADSKGGKPTLILLRDEAPGKSPPIDLGNGFAKVVVRVADVAAVAARMKAAGYPVGEPNSSSLGPTILMITDPDGYTLELVQSGASHG